MEIIVLKKRPNYQRKCAPLPKACFPGERNAEKKLGGSKNVPNALQVGKCEEIKLNPTRP